MNLDATHLLNYGLAAGMFPPIGAIAFVFGMYWMVAVCAVAYIFLVRRASRLRYAIQLRDAVRSI